MLEVSLERGEGPLRICCNCVFSSLALCQYAAPRRTLTGEHCHHRHTTREILPIFLAPLCAAVCCCHRYSTVALVLRYFFSIHGGLSTLITYCTCDNFLFQLSFQVLSWSPTLGMWAKLGIRIPALHTLLK